MGNLALMIKHQTNFQDERAKVKLEQTLNKPVKHWLQQYQNKLSYI